MALFMFQTAVRWAAVRLDMMSLLIILATDKNTTDLKQTRQQELKSGESLPIGVGSAVGALVIIAAVIIFLIVLRKRISRHLVKNWTK